MKKMLSLVLALIALEFYAVEETKTPISGIAGIKLGADFAPLKRSAKTAKDFDGYPVFKITLEKEKDALNFKTAELQVLEGKIVGIFLEKPYTQLEYEKIISTFERKYDVTRPKNEYNRVEIFYIKNGSNIISIWHGKLTDDSPDVIILGYSDTDGQQKYFERESKNLKSESKKLDI